jgi:hypothetical protein
VSDKHDYSLALAVMTLETIADGRVGPETEGHYLAHREAVTAARSALAAIADGPKGQDGQLRDEPHSSPITDEMVEAGARAMNAHAFNVSSTAFWATREQDRARTKARACLEAAAAVRGETDE